MFQISKKVIERLTSKVVKFQNILRMAKDRDINESDTIAIIIDILQEVFGYDKYMELTSEFCIRGSYCDLALKVDNKIQFLIEAKSIGIELKDNHIKQAIDYGANQGVQWIVLTNGIIWQLYKIKFEQPINFEMVCRLNLLELQMRREEDYDNLFLFCKEGLIKDARDDYYEKIQSVNRFIIGALMLHDRYLTILRKELRSFSSNIKIETNEIKSLLETEVLKREVLEGEEAVRAQNKVKKFYGKLKKKSADTSDEKKSLEEQEPEIIKKEQSSTENALLVNNSNDVTLTQDEENK